MTRYRSLHSQPLSIDFQSELNPSQYEAVSYDGTRHLVIAGAGTGKTRVLTYRVAYLLQHGIPARHIVLLTFTNKAAQEMLKRVELLTGIEGLSSRVGGMWGGTFHSIALRILRAHAQYVGFSEQVSILDKSDQERLFTRCMDALGLLSKTKKKEEAPFPNVKTLLSFLGSLKNSCQSIEKGVASSSFVQWKDDILKLFDLFDLRKKKLNAVDFDDILVYVCQLFIEEPGIRERYNALFSYILVDEYQDVNPLQEHFINLLLGEQTSLMVVGDDAQSIYSWRGAQVDSILDFSQHYPEGVITKIETNYRSTPEILHLANHSIAHNQRQIPKEMRAHLASIGSKPYQVSIATSKDQALFVVHRIHALLDEGVEPAEIAVLYRSHHLSMLVQLELTKAKIDFSLTSGLRFFETAHIKDCTSLMRLVTNPHDEIAFLRIVQLLPRIGEKGAERLWQHWQKMLNNNGGALPESLSTHLLAFPIPVQGKALWEQLVYTLEECQDTSLLEDAYTMLTSLIEGFCRDYLYLKYEKQEANDRFEDLKQLKEYAKAINDVVEFLAQIALMSEYEISQNPQDKVTLSSVHQAKGLEWKVVFLLGLNEGVFPSRHSIENKESLEEERRLFYVAVTRAKQELYLMVPSLDWHSYAPLMASSFLQELDDELMELLLV